MCFIYFNNPLFPAELKKTDITSVYKKEEKYLKENCRPVSILPNISKFSKKMYSQVNRFFMSVLSKVQCGFRKYHKVLHQGGFSGMVMTNLSSAFDCTDHQLLIPKLHKHGFRTRPLEPIKNYLAGRN